MPQLHRGDRERDLGGMAAEPPDAPGIDPRGMAADMVLLEHDALRAAPRQMQRRGAAVEAAAEHDHIGGAGHGAAQLRTTALTAASVLGSAASSARVIGLTGGRRRK